MQSNEDKMITMTLNGRRRDIMLSNKDQKIRMTLNGQQLDGRGSIDYNNTRSLSTDDNWTECNRTRIKISE